MCGSPHEWLNTRNRPTLPSGVNQPFVSKGDAHAVPECPAALISPSGGLDFVVGGTRSIWVRERS